MIAHLINTDIGNRGILRVYLEYRMKNYNFLENAAKILLNNIENVLIVTGFPIPPMNICETDGTLGALALYNAIEKVGGESEILTYDEVERALSPFGVKLARKPEVEDYSLLISVETSGKAKDGKYYSMSGLEMKTKPFDDLFLKAKELGVPTLGIGDGGNEIGMGKIRELIKKYVPLGEKIGSIVETDELIVSAVSNWGAYGLIAQVSLEVGTNLLSDWEEKKNLEVIVRAGLIDGVSKKKVLSVDGISVGVHEKMIGLLKEIVKASL